MPKLPRMRAAEVESLLLRAGFQHLRSRGSHRIFLKGGVRIVIPYHAGRDLHPKAVRQALAAIEEAEA